MGVRWMGSHFGRNLSAFSAHFERILGAFWARFGRIWGDSCDIWKMRGMWNFQNCHTWDECYGRTRRTSIIPQVHLAHILEGGTLTWLGAYIAEHVRAMLAKTCPALEMAPVLHPGRFPSPV